MKELLPLIKERRSVRLFTGKKVPVKDIQSIIEAGTWAPTGCNSQEIRFKILESEDQINGLIRFKPFLSGVSHFILVLYDMSLPWSHQMYIKSKHQRTLPFIDAGLATQNMMLYAKSKSIDTCALNFSEHFLAPTSIVNKAVKRGIVNVGLGSHVKGTFSYFLRKDLKVPEHLKIVCAIAVGYAKRYPNIDTEMHGQRKVIRKDVRDYII